MLGESGTGLAEALLARLLRMKGDNEGAVRAYHTIQERWLLATFGAYREFE
jgi:hypothetical protein